MSIKLEFKTKLLNTRKRKGGLWLVVDDFKID